MSNKCSRIPGFYRLGIDCRRRRVAEMRGIETCALSPLDTGGIDMDVADGMIENVIGTYGLPFAIGLNFAVNGVDYLVPMAVEEPSVVAAASNAAKMVRAGGGFTAQMTAPVMIGQVQIVDVADPDQASAAITAAEDEILAQGRALTPRLVERGGGPVGVRVRILSRPEDPDGGMLAVHLLVDCRDAMGANLVNTVAEGLAPGLAELARGRVGLRILSNLADERLVTVTARIPDELLDSATGAEVRQAIVSASRFAELDPYRAATHNKGIMNGIDAALLATGNDWRGVEAGAHAYACRHGRYEPLAVWRSDMAADRDDATDDATATATASATTPVSGQNPLPEGGVSNGRRRDEAPVPAANSEKSGVLVGTLTMPMAVATVGGALHVHRGAQLAMRLLNVNSATELAGVIGAVGLASNLAALRALATDGIQRGHMALHARVVARAAGATGEQIEQVARAITALGDVKAERARQIVERLRHPGAAASHRQKESP